MKPNHLKRTIKELISTENPIVAINNIRKPYWKNFVKGLGGSLFVSALLLAGSTSAYAQDSTIPTNYSRGEVTNPEPNYFTKSSPSFNDFKEGQYWSQDMLWAIDKGLVQGYINTKHPSIKNMTTIGNWIDPQGILSEAQMITVLFRHAKPVEYNSIQPASSWWASRGYQLAEKYKVPANATLSNTARSSEVVTRGSLAQAMVTIHLGKVVNVQDAVKFMYDNGLSQGINVSKGKTYDNFGVNEKLQRAHIASFVKRYDDFLKSGGSIGNLIPVKLPAPPPASELHKGDQAKMDEIFALLNEERKENGKVPLIRNEQLDNVALYKSQDMGINDYYDHHDLKDNRTVRTAIDLFGFQKKSIITEVLMNGSTTPSIVVWAWMESAPHSEIIFLENAIEIGIGTYYEDGKSYTTALI